LADKIIDAVADEKEHSEKALVVAIETLNNTNIQA
jgi:hypothetical protein